ncbi:gluconokinase [Streptomyces sp.]|uniref:gluconokinase n=1 Tax=Streptomyces sp. TaxID=1931 RepID=UPI0028115AED|nr:gluconokinase [Streptomyces sp.]
MSPGDTAGAPLVVVMGVAGSGKTTIGALVAHESGSPFLDADQLHPLANVRKMAAGTPLDDADRWPWLDVVGQRLREAGETGTGMVLACSALKRRYRDRICCQAPGTVFLHLTGGLDVLSSRIEGRSEHFMPVSLLQSQLASLEPLDEDEHGYTLDIDQPIEDIVDEAIDALGEMVGASSPQTSL